VGEGVVDAVCAKGINMNCPFIDSNNPHCSESLNINRLDEAFDLCTNHYTMCPLYLQLSRDQLETVGVGVKQFDSKTL
jgi:hypothetical protein